MESVKHVIEKKVLTNENVMEVAAVAENFLVIFEDISKELQQRCGNFLATFSTVQGILEKSDDDFDWDLFKKLVLQANKNNQEKPVPAGGSVTISSTGQAKEMYPMIMGTYARTSELENGFPVYKKVNGPQQLYVDQTGFWSIR